MPKESFLMYLSFEELLSRLTPEELRYMVLAIFNYHRNGIEPDFSANRVLEMCWQPLKEKFERDLEKYDNICNRNRQNGLNGGRPSKPKKPTGFSETQENPKNLEYDYDYDYDIKKKSIIINNTPKKSVFGFDDFWKAYDKKNGKKNCEKLYAKISEQERAKIKEHVPKYVAATPDKKYRKDPQTYLHGECWNDEIITNNRAENCGGNFSQEEIQNGDDRFF